MTALPPNAPQADMRWLWGYVWRHHRLAAIIAISFGAVGGVLTALEPYLVGVIVDHLQAGESIHLDVALLLTIALISIAVFFVQRYASGLIAYGVTFNIRRDLFDNVLTLDYDFFQRHAIGDLIARMYSDIDFIWRLLAISFLRGGASLVMVIAAFILLAGVNLPLTLIVFAVLSVSTAFQLYAGRAIAPLMENVRTQNGALSSLVQDSVSGIQTLKTFGREGGAARQFAHEADEFRKTWLFFKRRNEPVGMLPNMISQLTTGVVVLIGGLLAAQGTLTLGNFAQFLIFLTLISSVLLNLGIIYQRYQQTRGALTRLTLLLQPTTIADKPNARHLDAPRGDIQFDHVSLEIDGTPALHDVTLRIPPGTVAALVGPTGCGKTTLINLLARVIDPTAGSVRIDGIDVRDLALDDLRAAVAYVPQSTFLFSEPLHENIRMGIDATPDDLDRAIHIARVSNDLPQLPNGLETMVGEKGVMLSGGQKQRVAIARAVLRDPAILVLDDALSSVDMQTAADILGDLRDVLRSRTSVIIAHRIATVKDADLIVVMDEGRVIDQGTHETLIARGGLYAQMVMRELSEGEGE